MERRSRSEREACDALLPLRIVFLPITLMDGIRWCDDHHCLVANTYGMRSGVDLD